MRVGGRESGGKSSRGVGGEDAVGCGGWGQGNREYNSTVSVCGDSHNTIDSHVGRLQVRPNRIDDGRQHL